MMIHLLETDEGQGRGGGVIVRDGANKEMCGIGQQKYATEKTKEGGGS